MDTNTAEEMSQPVSVATDDDISGGDDEISNTHVQAARRRSIEKPKRTRNQKLFRVKAGAAARLESVGRKADARVRSSEMDTNTAEEMSQPVSVATDDDIS